MKSRNYCSDSGGRSFPFNAEATPHRYNIILYTMVAGCWMLLVLVNTTALPLSLSQHLYLCV